MKVPQKAKKLGVIGLTVLITAYLVYRVYSEASEINFRPSQLLSVYTLLAVLFGVFGYFTYTLIWYLYLDNVAPVRFYRVLLANLSGTYLSFSLNVAIGTLIKVKFIGVGYFVVLATSLMDTSTEFLIGTLMLFAFNRDPGALAVALFFILAFVADRQIYRLALRFPRIIGRGENMFNEFYHGWHVAKSNPRRVLLAMLLGTLLVLMNAGTLMSVARVFGVHLSLSIAVEAVLYSNVLGSVLGTPGGVGGNELGVMMAIGSGGLDVIIAFLFKFINQYMFAIFGAFAFYHFVSAEVREQSPETAELD
ncbi:lysylphosphatidylglycerol synthase domain-containing protein [Thermococcus sp.]|uniref:lysylphosphatidylglycerol synthase transmembrane domain-containing protein n=1 Tax=Thermococcus sp. TaxID=35749 RepID=UPI0026376E52|nr:lysylphosphatidylglycerol synthase domain-containing protein [Thermococcus sp.]